jgi:hypothetical protein
MSTQLVAGGYDFVAGGDDFVEYIGADGAKRMVKANRCYALPLPLISLLTLTAGTLANTPSKPFRPDKLTLFSAATGILVSTITAGNVTQTIGQGAAGSNVNWEHYSPNALGVRMKGETVLPGVGCSVQVSNPTAGTLAISGNFTGLSDQ